MPNSHKIIVLVISDSDQDAIKCNKKCYKTLKNHCFRRYNVNENLIFVCFIYLFGFK